MSEVEARDYADILKSMQEKTEQLRAQSWEYRRYEQTWVRRLYIGSSLTLDPCGRYHHMLSPGSLTIDTLPICEQFWADMEQAAEECGVGLTSGEGDPLDQFIEQSSDSEEYTFTVTLPITVQGFPLSADQIQSLCDALAAVFTGDSTVEPYATIDSHIQGAITDDLNVDEDHDLVIQVEAPVVTVNEHQYVTEYGSLGTCPEHHQSCYRITDPGFENAHHGWNHCARCGDCLTNDEAYCIDCLKKV